MARSSNWERARDWIRADIAGRHLTDGDRLPPEQDIQRACGVGRHSVRRAVAALASEGVISVEQGRGTFVRARPAIRYDIGSRTRYSENLEAAGVVPASEPIDDQIMQAPPDVADALGLDDGAIVHCVLRSGLADGAPLTLNRSFHCVARFPDFAQARATGLSVTEIYRRAGIDDYRRRETVLYARLPEPWEARMLAQRPEQPVMVICKLDETPDGTPIGYSEAIWSAGRVRFSLISQGADV